MPPNPLNYEPPQEPKKPHWSLRLLLGVVRYIGEMVLIVILIAEMVLIPHWLAMDSIALAVVVTTLIAATTVGIATWIGRLLDRAAGKRRRKASL